MPVSFKLLEEFHPLDLKDNEKDLKQTLSLHLLPEPLDF